MTLPTLKSQTKKAPTKMDAFDPLFRDLTLSYIQQQVTHVSLHDLLASTPYDVSATPDGLRFLSENG
jgi:hypothetical protein